MQAAILIEKLKIFEDEIAARNEVAARYARGLGNLVTVPRLASGCTSVWAQYTIRLPKGTNRDDFAAALRAQGIPTAIYYTKSMHQQTAYKGFPGQGGYCASKAALVMATNMTVPMVGWMWHRGHSPAALAEMAAAMYAPFVACFPLVWFGVLAATGLMIAGHVVMVPAMTVAMLWRLDEYTGHTHERAHA